MLSIRGYARHRGVSDMAVHKAIRSGRLRDCLGKDARGTNKIADVALADREWSTNTDQGFAPKSRAPAPAVAPPPSGKPKRPKVEAAAEEEPAAAEAVPTGPSYAQSRAERESYMLLMAKLEYEEKSRMLLSADAVRLAIFNAARKCRDMLMSVPDRVAPLVVGNPDAHDVHRILTDEIRRVCVEIAAIRPPAS